MTRSAFELAPFGVRVKTVAPGGIRTDFAGRSLVFADHPAYAEQIQKVTSVFMAPERLAAGSSAEQIAEVVYKAATDGSAQLRYVAGADAQVYWTQRNALGSEAFHASIGQSFLG